MSEPALMLLLLTFAVIGLLPSLFFRNVDGRFGPRWWLTAMPFFLGPAILITARTLSLHAVTPTSWSRWQALAAVTLAAASLALIFLTLGTHRTRIAAFQQQNDEPEHIVTDGAYAHIRHPFYSAFLLAFLASAALFPHWTTLLLLVYAATGLTITAAREERRLSTSAFGEQYQRYMARTGRFIPRLGTRRAAMHAAGDH